MNSVGDRPLDQVVGAMRTALKGAFAQPEPGVSITKLTERTAGLGNRLGNEARGPFAAVALKAIRVEAEVNLADVLMAPSAEDALARHQDRVLRARDRLTARGFLGFKAGGMAFASAAQDADGDIPWHVSATYQVLFEFPYEDTDGAMSLIVQIPARNPPPPEVDLTIRGDLVRWDHEDPLPLRLRGPAVLKGLALLGHLDDVPPGGAVTLTRDVAGVTAVPRDFSALGDFLAALADPDDPLRHARLTFDSFAQFVGSFADPVEGNEPIGLGDPDGDGTVNLYRYRPLTFSPPLALPTPTERLEIALGEHLGQGQVAYLKPIVE